ncbi:SigB/SigF/SigG family RNA polymerase sigma factor [Streptomyces sp. NPDC058268]|uniref:SigB/SigF/SigG family RNA polymerase sigma factor n=1 Tax=Streptomyces sp. NPDC058268 TaxID=3346413 RepID=UPI0036E060D3
MMVTKLNSSPAGAISHAERHTTDLGGAAALAGLPDPPSLSAVDRPAAADIRKLSKSLFTRLGELEGGTDEHAYVRNSLVELNLNLVHYAANRMRPHTESYEDVVQVRTIGLIKAINRFELQRSIEFPNFALPTIMGEIKRFFRDTTWAVHVPRRLQDLRLDLMKATSVLEQAHGRPPTTAELAEHLGRDEAEVAEGLAAANGYTAVSLDQPADGGDSDDLLTDHIGHQDAELLKVENVQALKPLIADLPERERTILSLRFVADRTQSEIGRELGLSQMYVSRTLARTLTRLHTKLTTKQ